MLDHASERNVKLEQAKVGEPEPLVTKAPTLKRVVRQFQWGTALIIVIGVVLAMMAITLGVIGIVFAPAVAPVVASFVAVLGLAGIILPGGIALEAIVIPAACALLGALGIASLAIGGTLIKRTQHNTAAAPQEENSEELAVVEKVAVPAASAAKPMPVAPVVASASTPAADNANKKDADAQKPPAQTIGSFTPYQLPY